MSKKEILKCLDELYDKYADEYKKQCDPYYMGVRDGIDLAMQEVEKLKDEY